MTTRLLCLAVMAWILVACGGGSGELPPARPTSTVSGNAVAAEIQNAQVAVYTLDRNGKGALLGSGVTDAQGFYSLEMQAPSQPVLVEVSGGHYAEEANGIAVNVDEGQVLQAVTLYQSGQPLSVMVTPLTQLAAGLAEYRIAQGTDPSEAVDTALNDTDQLFGVAVASVLPHNITDPNGATTQLTAPYTYGFLLAALSSFAQQVSQQNDASEHTPYTSLYLAQVMYNDIVSDGMLDGRGYNKAADAMMDLALGNVALNQDVYRVALAQHLLAVSDSPQNKTGLSRSELSDLAHRLSTNALFSAQAQANPVAFAPVIVPVLTEGSAFSGVYNFEVTITSVPGAESVRFSVDGVAVGDAADPAHPAVAIDTRAYADGTHTIGVTTTDFLGLSSHREFTYLFGNVFVNVTSAAVTNHTPFTLTGNYDDNGFGFKSLTIQGMAVSPNADKTWSAQVDLTVGSNHIPIVLETALGASNHSVAIVDYDVGPPVIDTSAGHGDACFSNGDGSCTEKKLTDNNTAEPLSIATDHTDLAGVAETRAALSDNNIPFFAFSASDPPSNGVNSPTQQLKVRIQYEKNGNVVVPWAALTPVNGEYLAPLATEVLSNAWLRSSPSDVHALRVAVEDLAGNITNSVFTFKVEFVVAPFTMGTVTDTGSATFAGVSFDQRGNLYNTTLTAEEYAFTNTTGKSFYISPGDDSIHSADNLIDQLVRENSVRLKTSTEWRAGFVENILNVSQCPSLPQNGSNDKWTPVTQVLNYLGGVVWNPVTVADPSFGVIQSVATDTPAAPSPSAWSQLADFDSTYAAVSAINLPHHKTLSYEYDYILNTSNLDQPAAVRNWKVVHSGHTSTCPDVNYLQQRQVYGYQSEPGFPKNTASTLRDSTNFPTSGFTVFDVTANAPLTAVSGWYLVPAAHAVLVRKQVTLPVLTLHNDIDVADPASFISYVPHQYDRTLTWSINRLMKMDVAPDGGVGNLFSMSSREVQVGSGMVSYQLSR